MGASFPTNWAQENDETTLVKRRKYILEVYISFLFFLNWHSILGGREMCSDHSFVQFLQFLVILMVLPNHCPINSSPVFSISLGVCLTNDVSLQMIWFKVSFYLLALKAWLFVLCLPRRTMLIASSVSPELLQAFAHRSAPVGFLQNATLLAINMKATWRAGFL